MTEHDVIPVFFTIDDAFAPFCTVAVASLVDHVDPARQYRLIVLYQNLSEAHRASMSSFARPNVEIVFRPMTENLSAITDRMGNRLRADFFTITIFYRLFLPRLFPEYDKGIYIDSDVVLNADIAKMYDIDLGENLIGAVAYHSIQHVPVLVEYLEKAIGVKRTDYINSGVLLLGMKALREHNLAASFLHYYDTYQFDCIAPDQDYLNALCAGKIAYIDSRWDTMPVKGEAPITDPLLIHYNLYEKPWHYDGVAYEDYFWKYASRCSCYPEILKVKRNYGPEQVAQDGEHMRLMVERARQISHSDLTFRKVFVEDKEPRL